MVLLFLYRWQRNGSTRKSPTGFYHKMLCSVRWFSGQSSAAVAKAPQTKLRCSYVEGIAIKMLRSTSRSCWLLRSIHISNDKSILYFLRIFSLFCHCQYFSRTCLYIWVTRRVCIRSRNFVSFRRTCVHLRSLMGSVLLIFLVLCVVFFVLFVFNLCLVYSMLPVFLECAFLIAPSVFSNVYLMEFILVQVDKYVCDVIVYGNHQVNNNIDEDFPYFSFIYY